MKKIQEDIERIVVINLLYLGDLMFAVPFYKNLRCNYPSVRIDIIANSNFSEILEGIDCFDNVYAYDKSMSIRESFSFGRSLRKNNYDLGINIHGNWRSVLLMKLINPGEMAGYADEPGTGLFYDIKLSQNGEQHMVEEYLSFSSHLRLDIKYRVPQLSVDLPVKGEIRNRLEEKGRDMGKPLVGLNTGGSWPSKRWPEKYFAKLADKLQLEENAQVVFFGGEGDLERVDRIAEKMESSPLNFAGGTSLMELAGLADECDLVISGDSGPAHVAAAVDTPVIALFGPSDEVKYRPYGEIHRVVKSDVDCRPCGEHKCPEKHYHCMRRIKPGQIMGMIKKGEKEFPHF